MLPAEPLESLPPAGRIASSFPSFSPLSELIRELSTSPVVASPGAGSAYVRFFPFSFQFSLGAGEGEGEEIEQFPDAQVPQSLAHESPQGEQPDPQGEQP